MWSAWAGRARPLLRRAAGAGSAVAAATTATLVWCDATPPRPRHGEVYAWGAGAFGQTGHGAEVDTPVPALVEGLRGHDVVHIATSGCAASSAALTADGNVYVWGCGRDGRLGLGGQAVRNQLVPLPLPGLPRDVVALAVGEYHGLALTAGGAVYGWGTRAAGTGGGAGAGTSPGSDDTAPAPVPLPVRVASVSCGREHSVAVGVDGSVWTWGVGATYALGLGGDKAPVPAPARVAALADTRVIKAAAGREHTLLLGDDGSVHVAGTDSYGQAGLGRAQVFVRTPARIGGELAGRVVVDVCAGEYASAALCADGAVLTWGAGREGGLGHGTTADSGSPRLLEPPPAMAAAGRVVALAQGGGHALLLTQSGRVFAVGRGRSGQLGRGDALESVAAYRTAPVEVASLAPAHLRGRRVVALAAGRDHSLALVADDDGGGGAAARLP
jgi:alpha-tubulin suppressor-like RCC1 family protein